MIRITKKENCSGCAACFSVCKVNGIKLSYDEEGFLYPEVDAQKCIGCGACLSVCPITTPLNIEEKIPLAYAVVSKNDEIRAESSSGGAFSHFAEVIIASGGVVFGAAFDEAFDVAHIGVDTLDGIEKLRGSKYVQSKIGNSYIEVEKYLISGIPVLFTGTPCQIAGLKGFLKKEYDNLLCQDIICHGVPSPEVWRTYLQEKSKQRRAAIRNVSFRNKRISWRQYSLQIEFENGKAYTIWHKKDGYMRSFLENFILRPSCFECKFKTVNRIADITLADLWGAHTIAPELDDNKGTSLVILHTDKGRRFFEKIKEHCYVQSIDLNAAISHNLSMVKSEDKNENREVFMRTFNEQGLKKAINLFCRESLLENVKDFMRKGRNRIKSMFSKNKT